MSSGIVASFLLNKEIITFPGRLSSWKGQESFIKLISNLPDNYSGLIVGPYEDAKKKYYKKLLNLIRDYNLEDRVFLSLGFYWTQLSLPVALKV